jgi:hypothetical protein
MEIVEVDQSGIKVRHKIGRFDRVLQLPAERIIYGLSVSQRRRWPYPPMFQKQFFDFYSQGKVAIGAPSRFWDMTVEPCFGSGLTESEAQTILTLIYERFPQYRPTDTANESRHGHTSDPM